MHSRFNGDTKKNPLNREFEMQQNTMNRNLKTIKLSNTREISTFSTMPTIETRHPIVLSTPWKKYRRVIYERI